MLMNKEIKPFLYPLEDIYRYNRRGYPARTSYSLHLTTMAYMQYWRELEVTTFPALSISAQDELYYWFTEKLLHIHETHLDLYWMIGDLDNQPLFISGREPARFWQKRSHTLRRFEYTY